MSVFHVLILEFWKWLSTLQGAFHPSMVVPCCCCSMSILVTCSIITWKLSSVFSTFSFKVDTFFLKLTSSKLIRSFNCTAGAMPFHCRHTFASCFWAASLCLPGRPQWWIHCLQWYTIWFVCLPSELIFFTLWARIFIFQVLANRS